MMAKHLDVVISIIYFREMYYSTSSFYFYF